jgi:hypothetical protein
MTWSRVRLEIRPSGLASLGGHRLVTVRMPFGER